LGQTVSKIEEEILLIVKRVRIIRTGGHAAGSYVSASPRLSSDLGQYLPDLFRPDISSTARLKMVCLVLIKDGGLSWQAEERHRQALGWERRWRAKSIHPHWRAMNNLTAVLRDQGKYEQAEVMHRQALRLRKAVEELYQQGLRLWEAVGEL
jgi:hypothetical protein